MTAENIRQLLLGWEQYKRDHIRESEALDVESILMSEYSQYAAQQNPPSSATAEEYLKENHPILNRYLTQGNIVNVYKGILDVMEAYATLQNKPQPTAEGTEEIKQGIDELIKIHIPINAANFDYCVKYNIINGGLLQGIRDVATLHAQRLADKMVEERLREELIKYDQYYWGGNSERDVDAYLKNRKK